MTESGRNVTIDLPVFVTIQREIVIVFVESLLSLVLRTFHSAACCAFHWWTIYRFIDAAIDNFLFGKATRRNEWDLFGKHQRRLIGRQ